MDTRSQRSLLAAEDPAYIVAAWSTGHRAKR